jgi:[protein-PII] uridylyltransferase
VEQARVFMRSDGTALDWLMVSPPSDVNWLSVVADLQAAYRDDLDVAAAVAKRERARDVRPPALAEPVAVRINAVPGDGVTRVEVRGPDSPGVLYRMSRALADLGTELHGAMVSTLGPEVRNTFYVSGTVPSAEELQAALTPALLRTPAVA